MSAEPSYILLLPAASHEASAKGLLPSAVAAVKLDPAALQKNLAAFVGAFAAALEPLPPDIHGFRIDEIEIVVEISGEGSVQLVGGVKVGASGGITLKLKR